MGLGGMTVPSSLRGDKTCPLGTPTQHGGCRTRWHPCPWVQDPHSQMGTHACLTRYLIFCNFGVAKGLWDLLSCLPPLALPVLHMSAQEPLAGGLRAHCRGFKP